MSLWQLKACERGFRKANGIEDPIEAPTPEEHDSIVERFAHL